MSARNPIAGPDGPIPGAADLRGADPAPMSLASESAAPVPEALPVEALKARIAEMVRGYVARRSPQLARCIAHYSSALALHPALRDEPEQRAAFCRLNRHWNLLAAQCPAAAVA